MRQGNEQKTQDTSKSKQKTERKARKNSLAKYQYLFGEIDKKISLLLLIVRQLILAVFLPLFNSIGIDL